MGKAKIRESGTVETEIDGAKHEGRYEVQGGLVRVFYRTRSKETQVGGHKGYERGLARILLGELVREGN